MRNNIRIQLANKPIFLIIVLFVLLNSMVAVMLLSSYSREIGNIVYSSEIPHQDENIIGGEQENSNISDNSLVENESSKVSSNSTLITSGCTPGYGYDKNSPNPVCIPLDGSEKPEGLVTCMALGCPYNPPNLNAGPPAESNNNSLIKQ